jgi:hypothetical protein
VAIKESSQELLEHKLLLIISKFMAKKQTSKFAFLFQIFAPEKEKKI